MPRLSRWPRYGFARRGEVTVTLLDEAGRTGLTVVARDVGPGIPDLRRALRDGFSTYGGPGLGLPGVRRLMNEFEIVSETTSVYDNPSLGWGRVGDR